MGVALLQMRGGGMNSSILRDYLHIQDLCTRQEKINHNWLADIILEREKIITLDDTMEIFVYNLDSGLYELGERYLDNIIQFCATHKAKTHLVNEVKESIRRRTFIKRTDIASNPDEIPIENGVYNFVKYELRPYDPNKIFMSKHPISIGLEDQPLPEDNPIEQFLIQVTEKTQDTVYLKEFIGYCFYRKMPFHTITILVGAGSNGKSVFLNILREMLGRGNVSDRSIQELGEDKFATSDLYGKNANVVGDLPSKALTDTGLLKRATGNDVLTAQKKYQPSFTFRPYAKIICAANEVPETPDHSAGFFRRMQIINFPHSFEGKENRRLFEELTTPENLAGFFLSCMESFKDALEANAWILTDTIEQKKEKYMNYSNSANAFCQINLDYDPDSDIPTEEIYNKYKAWCSKHKLIVKDDRQFFPMLYRFFSGRTYKKRKTLPNYHGYDVRQYVIVGLVWKEEDKPTPSN